MKRANVLNLMCFWLGFGVLVPSEAVALDHNQREIVGGEIVTDLSSFEYKHTVRLLVKGTLTGSNIPDKMRGLKLNWRCSGTLLSKRIVLSAAHCFPKTIGFKNPDTGEAVRAELTGVGAEIFFKTDTRADQPWGLKSEKIIVHSGFRDEWTSKVEDVWNPSEPIHDIALVKLPEDAPSDKLPVSFLGSQDAPLASGEDGVLAGYGKDIADDQIAIPRLRRVDVPLRESLQNRSEWYVGRGDLQKAGKVDRPKGGCVGDSGGPLYLKRAGGVRLAGIIVRGPDEQNGGCEAAVTIVTAIPAYSSWITENMKSLTSQ